MIIGRWLFCIAVAAAAEPPTVDASPSAAVLGGGDLSSYELGPGDVVRVRVYGEDDLTGEYPVDGSGRINMPLLGGVEVAGETADGVARVLTRRLADGYLRDPDVTVWLDGFRSQPVSVLGGVNNPGVYYLEGPTTLVQVLSQAGGVADGGVDEVQLTRGQGGGVERIRYADIISGTARDIQLRAGDTIVVPDRRVSFVGQVQSPGALPFRDDMTVVSGLAAAGGASETASLVRVVVVRNGESMRVNVRRILAGKRPDVPLQPGDQVFVKESIF